MAINQEIIDRFLQNKSNSEENALVEKWYYSFEKNNDGISHLPYNEQIRVEDELYKKIKQKIEPINYKAKNHSLYYWASAAAIVLIAFGLWFYEKTATNHSAALAVQKEGWISYENNTNTDLKIDLPDGSKSILKPKTKLSYKNSSQLREANLVGEAFFDVKKDASHPFMIYTGKVTTKVLGTSFSIKAFPEIQKFEVSVISGKVTVYEKEKEITNKKENGVILTPNLKVTFYNKEEHFITGLVETPEVLPSIKKEEINFNFQNVPLNEVLKTLEKAYGIEMVLENETLGKCTLNGDLEQMPLYTKLDIITRSLNAQYTIKGTSILVSGSGCE